MDWKDILYLQKSAQAVVVVLLVLFVLTGIWLALMRQQAPSPTEQMRHDSLVREFAAFQQSLQPLPPERAQSGQYTERARPDFPAQRTSSERNTPPENTYPQNHTPYPRQEKLTPGQTILLNSTDTADWKKIPGIGSSFASRIVNYRNLLGGFATVQQLREVYGVDNELFAKIAPYIEPDANFRKIHINQQEFKELLSHPYINYQQAQAIVHLRKRKGDILSIDELGMLNAFTPQDIERLRPYVAF